MDRSAPSSTAVAQRAVVGPIAHLDGVNSGEPTGACTMVATRTAAAHPQKDSVTTLSLGEHCVQLCCRHHHWSPPTAPRTRRFLSKKLRPGRAPARRPPPASRRPKWDIRGIFGSSRHLWFLPTSARRGKGLLYSNHDPLTVRYTRVAAHRFEGLF